MGNTCSVKEVPSSEQVEDVQEVLPVSDEAKEKPAANIRDPATDGVTADAPLSVEKEVLATKPKAVVAEVNPQKPPVLKVIFKNKAGEPQTVIFDRCPPSKPPLGMKLAQKKPGCCGGKEGMVTVNGFNQSDSVAKVLGVAQGWAVASIGDTDVSKADLKDVQAMIDDEVRKLPEKAEEPQPEVKPMTVPPEMVTPAPEIESSQKEAKSEEPQPEAKPITSLTGSQPEEVVVPAAKMEALQEPKAEDPQPEPIAAPPGAQPEEVLAPAAKMEEASQEARAEAPQQEGTSLAAPTGAQPEEMVAPDTEMGASQKEATAEEPQPEEKPIAAPMDAQPEGVAAPAAEMGASQKSAEEPKQEGAPVA